MRNFHFSYSRKHHYYRRYTFWGSKRVFFPRIFLLNYSSIKDEKEIIIKKDKPIIQAKESHVPVLKMLSRNFKSAKQSINAEFKLHNNNPYESYSIEYFPSDSDRICSNGKPFMEIRRGFNLINSISITYTFMLCSRYSINIKNKLHFHYHWSFC